MLVYTSCVLHELLLVNCSGIDWIELRVFSVQWSKLWQFRRRFWKLESLLNECIY